MKAKETYLIDGKEYICIVQMEDGNYYLVNESNFKLDEEVKSVLLRHKQEIREDKLNQLGISELPDPS